MSYGADFAAVDTAGAPLSVGGDSYLWGAVLLAILAAGLVGWAIGYFTRPKVDAAEAIWKAVDNAVKEAMKANTEALPARAGELRRVLEARLGKTLKFGAELTASIKALDTAIKGEIEDKAPAGAGSGKAAVSCHPGGAGSAAAASAAASNVTIVSMHPHPAPSAPAAPSAAPAPPAPAPAAKPDKRPMTTKEQNDALRLAVVTFDDYWRHKKAREDNIRDVVAELTNPGPKAAQPMFSPSGGLSGTPTTT